MWVLDLLPFWVFHLVVLIGLGGLFISLALKIIPFISVYNLPIQVASIAILVFGVFIEGGISNQTKWKSKVAELQLEMAQKNTASAEASTKVVTQYITKVQIVKEKGDAIIKTIPKYISKDADAKCFVPNGFVVLHDSASKNEVPDATRSVDAETADAKLSDIATIVTENYTTYYTVAEQLKSLQEWIRTQQSIYNK